MSIDTRSRSTGLLSQSKQASRMLILPPLVSVKSRRSSRKRREPQEEQSNQHRSRKPPKRSRHHANASQPSRIPKRISKIRRSTTHLHRRRQSLRSNQSSRTLRRPRTRLMMERTTVLTDLTTRTYERGFVTLTILLAGRWLERTCARNSLFFCGCICNGWFANWRWRGAIYLDLLRRGLRWFQKVVSGNFLWEILKDLCFVPLVRWRFPTAQGFNASHNHHIARSFIELNLDSQSSLYIWHLWNILRPEFSNLLVSRCHFMVCVLVFQLVYFSFLGGNLGYHVFHFPPIYYFKIIVSQTLKRNWFAVDSSSSTKTSLYNFQREKSLQIHENQSSICMTSVTSIPYEYKCEEILADWVMRKEKRKS